jgi:hypothetical protein
MPDQRVRSNHRWSRGFESGSDRCGGSLWRAAARHVATTRRVLLTACLVIAPIDSHSPFRVMNCSVGIRFRSTRWSKRVKPEREHRHQTLPAAEHLGVVPVRRKQRDRLLDARRRVVLESGWLSRLCTFEVLYRRNETVEAPGEDTNFRPKRSEMRSRQRPVCKLGPSTYRIRRRRSEMTNVDTAEAARFRRCPGTSAQGRPPPAQRTRPLRRRRQLAEDGSRGLREKSLPARSHRRDRRRGGESIATGVRGVLVAEDFKEGLKLPPPWRGSLLAAEYASYAGEPSRDGGGRQSSRSRRCRRARRSLLHPRTGGHRPRRGDRRRSPHIPATTPTCSTGPRAPASSTVDAIIAAAPSRLHRTDRTAPLRALTDGDPWRRRRLALRGLDDDDLDLHAGSASRREPLREHLAASPGLGAGCSQKTSAGRSAKRSPSRERRPRSRSPPDCSGDPVQWIEDRYENLVAAPHARREFVDVSVGTTETGSSLR